MAKCIDDWKIPHYTAIWSEKNVDICWCNQIKFFVLASANISDTHEAAIFATATCIDCLAKYSIAMQ